MKKIICVFLTILLLSGCGKFSRFTASVTGYDVICVDGVNYIQFTSGVTVKYDNSGKIELCSK